MQKRFTAYAQQLICKLIGVKFKLEGVGYINIPEPTIFIINHQSCLDAAGEHN